MPHMDGYTATKNIRDLLAKSFDLERPQRPIIAAVTGHTEPIYVKRSKECGMDYFYKKPVTA